MRIILFDIDGTLLLSGGAGLEALRRVFLARYGVPEAAHGIEFHGLTDPLILRNIVKKTLGRDLLAGELESIRADYVAELPVVLEEAAPRFRVLDGARELVHELSERGDVLLGLATGNFEDAAWAKLRRGDLHGYFGFGGFGSDAEDRLDLTRHAVERGRARAGTGTPVIVVGDTIHDVRCAAGVGAECLAVATGNADEATLAAAGARWTVPSLADEAVREALGLV